MDKNERVTRLIRGLPVAMLCTQESDGSLRSRPMLSPKQAFDGSLRFFIESKAAAFLGSKGTAPVSLGYVDPENERFVSVSGRAQLIGRSAAVDKLWSEQFKAWFPKGKADSNLAVLEVQVDRVEGWDARKGGHLKLEFD